MRVPAQPLVPICAQFLAVTPVPLDPNSEVVFQGRIRGGGSRVSDYLDSNNRFVGTEPNSIIRSTENPYNRAIFRMRARRQNGSMRKQCRECRSMMNADAPHCGTCGCQFARVSRLRANPSTHTATWTGRGLAIACGLLAASIAHFLYA